jgi:hypothetical protein
MQGDLAHHKQLRVELDQIKLSPFPAPPAPPSVSPRPPLQVLLPCSIPDGWDGISERANQVALSKLMSRVTFFGVLACPCSPTQSRLPRSGPRLLSLPAHACKHILAETGMYIYRERDIYAYHPLPFHPLFLYSIRISPNQQSPSTNTPPQRPPTTDHRDSRLIFTIYCSFRPRMFSRSMGKSQTGSFSKGRRDNKARTSFREHAVSKNRTERVSRKPPTEESISLGG